MTVACPFCNAEFEPAALRKVGDSVPCPRCGDPLPAHLVKDLPSATTPPATPLPAPAPSAMSAGWTNRRIALSITGIMVVMAGVGLAFALFTESFRRKNDYLAKKAPPAPFTAPAPGELVGLGYLPADCNVVAAVNVADLLADPASKKLLDAPRPLLLELALGAVEKWTTLKAAQLDHVVLGSTLGAKLPQLTAIIRTRVPYDIVALGEALAPARPVKHKGGLLFRFTLQPGECMLWCAEPRTLVLLLRLDALKMQDLEAVSVPPRQQQEAAPPAIRAVFERVGKRSPAWLAGNFDGAGAVKDLLATAPLAAFGLSRDDARFLSKINAMTLSLDTQDGLALTGNFQGADEAATRAIQKRLEEIEVPGAASRKVVAPPPAAQGPDAGWVTLQLRGDAAAIRHALGPPGQGN